MSAPPIPEALAALAGQRGVPTGTWSLHGKLDLRIDDRIRVKARPGRRPNEVVFEARLGELPASAEDCGALLTRVMLHVTAGAADHIGTITISADGRQLLLQALVNGADATRFDASLESFLNELDRWIAVVGAEHS
jgi:Tir chaperone protein (CesT) family